MMLITNRKTSKTAHFQRQQADDPLLVEGEATPRSSSSPSHCSQTRRNGTATKSPQSSRSQLQPQLQQRRRHVRKLSSSEEVASSGSRMRHQAPVTNTTQSRNKPSQSQQQQQQQHQQASADHCTGSVATELFLPNPVTGGFDATPDYYQYQYSASHPKHTDYLNHNMVAAYLNDDSDFEGEQGAEIETLRDSDIYTSCTTPGQNETTATNSNKPSKTNASRRRGRDRGSRRSNLRSGRTPKSKTMKSKKSKSKNKAAAPFARYFDFPYTKKQAVAKSNSSSNASRDADNNNNNIGNSNSNGISRALWNPPEATTSADNKVREVTPSPTRKNEKKKKGLLQQLKQSFVTGIQSPPRKSTGDTEQEQEQENNDEHPRDNMEHLYHLDEEQPTLGQYHCNHVRTSSNPQTPWGGGQQQQPISRHRLHRMVTPSTASTPRVRPPMAHAYHSHASLMDEEDEQQQYDDNVEGLVIPLTTSPCHSITSSCPWGEMMSFSTFGNNTNKHSQWTFQAVSPCTPIRSNIARCCNNDADSVEVSGIVNEAAYIHDNHSSYMEGEVDDDDHRTDGGYDRVTIDLYHDAASIQSRGALLLTEEGLQKHNDIKSHRHRCHHSKDDSFCNSSDPTAFSDLKNLQEAGAAGKLETQVLQQKVKRMQEREEKKLANKRLEEEEAVRKYRHHRKYKDSDDDDEAAIYDSNEKRDKPADEEEDARSDACRAPDNPRRILQESRRQASAPQIVPADGKDDDDDEEVIATPAKISATAAVTPKSMSPQVSKAQTPSPANIKQKLTSTAKPWAIVKKLFHKKPDPEELKRQWKERERKRVQLAALEKEEAERMEKERIEKLRQEYLEKQRELEAAAAIAAEENFAKNNDESTIGDSTVYVQDLASISTKMPRTIVVNPDKHDLMSTSNSTAPTLSTSRGSYAPCSVCNNRERTHICMPCMHYAFCARCVKGRSECPLCHRHNVTFSKVITEFDC